MGKTSAVVGGSVLEGPSAIRPAAGLETFSSGSERIRLQLGGTGGCPPKVFGQMGGQQG